MASASAAILVATATAVAVAAVTSAVSAASTVMAMASAAASASVYILAVKSFSEFLLGSFAYAYNLSLEVEGLACHLVVEVHLHYILCHLENYAWDHCAHAVHHWDGVADNEKILADLSVDLERCLRKLNDSLWVNLAVSVCWCESYIECCTWLKSFDSCLELRKEVACSVDIVQRALLWALVNDLAVNLEFVAEFYYCVY